MIENYKYTPNFATAEDEVTAEKCPVEFGVEFARGELMFKWKCTGALIDSASSCRSILIVDVGSFAKEEFWRQLVELFYRRLTLGHFLKVLYVGFPLKEPWIEKTAAKFSCPPKNPSEAEAAVNLTAALKYAFRQAKKLNEVTDISIVAAGYGPLSRFDKIRALKESMGYHYPISLFLQADFEETQDNGDFSVYFFGTDAEMRQELKNFFTKKQRTKMANCQIRLQPMNGQLILGRTSQVPSHQDWQTDGDYLVKYNYFMLDNIEYVETLNINNFNFTRILFQLEFAFELTDSSKYLMSEIFSIEAESRPDRNGQPIQAVLKSHSDQTTERLTELSRRVFNRPQSVLFSQLPNNTGVTL